MPAYFSYGGGSSSGSTYTPKKVGSGSGGGPGSISVPESDGAGKGSLDLTDPLGSAADTVGSIAEFGGGLIGGFAGAIGSIGPDGETASIGQLFEDVGRIPGGVGDFTLPYLGNDPAKRQLQPDGTGLVGEAKLSQIPGAIYEPLYQVNQALQGQMARERVDYYQRKVETTKAGRERLPADLEARLDAGEDPNVIAEELVARNAGYSDNPVLQLGSEIVLDPLNLIAPGVGKGLQAVKGASRSVQVPADFARMGLTSRMAGTAYLTASRHLSRAGAAFVDKALGPTTSGAFQYLGARPFRTVANGLGRLDRTYAATLDDAGAVANANLLNAVMVDDLASTLGKQTIDDLDGSVAAAMTATRRYAPKELERRAEDLLRRTAPDFLGMSADELTEFAANAFAKASSASVDDVRRVIGVADVKMAQTAHWLRYGKAIDEFGEAREAAMLGDVTNIDVQRLTLIGEDTLTVERAAALAKATPGTIYDEAMKYEVLRNHFLGKVVSDTEILAFVKKLKDKGALHHAVKAPKSGKNKLPGPLSEWQQKWRDDGYILGFAPKDGIKTILDADGETVIWSKPFINVTTRRDPTAIANPLGRFMDATGRGITQGRIIHESRDRMLRLITAKNLPIAPNSIRSIHKAILDEAASRKVTPRALVGENDGGEVVYNAIFKRFLSPAEYKALTDEFDPTFVVMRSFAGNWETVGLTQKATGIAKVVPIIAKIAEGLYPKARFTYRPTFQIQEMIESPVFNALRGVTRREMNPELRAAYDSLMQLPEFKYLEAVEYLNIAGDRLATRFLGTNSPVGRALGRFTNIQARKETARVTQVLSEHGDEFKEAVEAIDPRLYAAMREAYGTSDPREIADKFLTERMRLASGDIDEAMAAVDEAAMGMDNTPLMAGSPGNAPTSRGDVSFSPGRLLDGGPSTRPPTDLDTVAVESYAFNSHPTGPNARPSKHLDAAFEAVSPSPGAMTLYRSVSRADLDRIVASGDEYTHPGYMSTATSHGLTRPHGVGYGGKDDVVIRVEVPPGTRALDVDNAIQTWPGVMPLLREKQLVTGERLLPFGSTFDVVREGDQVILRMRPATGGAVKTTAPAWASASPEGEMVWQAFKDSFRTSSIQAFKTHFFNPRRGWLERTVNHPYLGLYPLSYMWGKVLPEFARFLLIRPFGKNVPLVPIVNLERVQQAYLGALADDPAFSQYMQDHEESIYFANLLFPGNPVNLAVNAPAWARHVSEDLRAGKDITTETVAREIADSGSYALAGGVKDVESFAKVAGDLGSIAQDLFANLDKAAREYDGMAGVR